MDFSFKFKDIENEWARMGLLKCIKFIVFPSIESFGSNELIAWIIKEASLNLIPYFMDKCFGSLKKTEKP